MYMHSDAMPARREGSSGSSFLHMAQFLHSLNKQQGVVTPERQANGMHVSLVFSIHIMAPHVPPV